MLVFREAAGSGDRALWEGAAGGATNADARPRATVLNVSVPTPVGWYFFTVRFGRERRSLDRLIVEGQVSLAKLSLAYTLAVWVLAGLVALGVMVGLYLVKSMAGINLMDGPSFLHNFIFSGLPVPLAAA